MWVRVKIEQDKWVSISAYGPSTEKRISGMSSMSVSGVLVLMSRW